MADSAYNDAFYDDQADGSYAAAGAVLPLAFALLDAMPRSVVDVGCGVGTWLKQALALGVEDVVGLDGDYVPQDKLRIDKGQFRPADLKQDFATALNRRFDMAISLEVAEHLPPERGPSFVRQLCALSDKILFSAAVPAQGGTGHVHENWPEYWALLFARQGFACFDPLRDQAWTHPQVPWWYAQNMLFFSRGAASARLEKFRAPYSKPLTRLHPIGMLNKGGEPPLMGDASKESAYYLDLDRKWRAGAGSQPGSRPLPSQT